MKCPEPFNDRLAPRSAPLILEEDNRFSLFPTKIYFPDNPEAFYRGSTRREWANEDGNGEAALQPSSFCGQFTLYS